MLAVRAGLGLEWTSELQFQSPNHSSTLPDDDDDDADDEIH